MTLYSQNKKKVLNTKKENCNRKLGELTQNNLKADTHQINPTFLKIDNIDSTQIWNSISYLLAVLANCIRTYMYTKPLIAQHQAQWLMDYLTMSCIWQCQQFFISFKNKIYFHRSSFHTKLSKYATFHKIHCQNWEAPLHVNMGDSSLQTISFATQGNRKKEPI